jgi:dTDP-4-dehydrorhamnose 3,5-epimerase-like enzyme
VYGQKGATLVLASVRWIDFTSVTDERGSLTAIESKRHCPFEVKRVFYVHGVVSGADRGGHAHRDTDQLLVCVHGQVSVEALDGRNKASFVLGEPTRGIYVPRMVFVRLYDFFPESVLLVLASTEYHPNRSIRTWADYVIEVGK